MNFARVKELQEADLALLKDKNADYGNDNLLATGIYGIAVRLTDKVARLRNLTEGNVVKAAKNESVEDTLRDISNYGLAGRLLLEGQVGDTATQPPVPPAASSESHRTIAPDGRMVYLAGPIDHVSREDAMGWRELISTSLQPDHWATFSPAGAVANGAAGPGRSVQICLAAIEICDCLVAYLPDNTMAFGTIREIEYAKTRNKPVCVISPWAGKSLFSVDLVVVNDFDEVRDWLKTL